MSDGKVRSFVDYSYIRLARRKVREEENEGVSALRAYICTTQVLLGYSDERMCAYECRG